MLSSTSSADTGTQQNETTADHSESSPVNSASEATPQQLPKSSTAAVDDFDEL